MPKYEMVRNDGRPSDVMTFADDAAADKYVAKNGVYISATQVEFPPSAGSNAG